MLLSVAMAGGKAGGHLQPSARFNVLRPLAELLPSRGARIAAVIGGAIVIALLILGMFPWGALKGPIERRLSARVGRPVTIAAMERRDWFSYRPTIEVRGVSVPQPSWAGNGTLAQIDRATMRFDAFGLLIGRVSPRAITIDHGSIDLIRRADGNTNTGDSSGNGPGIALTELTVRDLSIRYRDAVRDRWLQVRLQSDADHGLRIAGSGMVTGAPVRIEVSGPSVAAGTGKPWPFHARVAGGNAIDLDASGTMDRPLDLANLNFTMRARADDLKRIDAVIEAGLFGTKAVDLTAKVQRTGQDWTIERLTGTIGQSDLAGTLTVKKRGGRVRLDGKVVSQRLAFDDLSSVAGEARAMALERAEGLKLVPNTRVNLAKMSETDGRIEVRIANVISPHRPSAIKRVSGVLTLDRSKLDATQLVIGLTRGTIAGRASIDQRDGRRVPTVMLDLRMEGATLATLGGGGGNVDAPVRGRVRLTGDGDTVRDAVGRANGRIGIVAQNGVLPAKIAAALGFDAGRALTKGDDDRARLRCAVATVDLRGGLGRFDPLVIDTALSGTRGQGTLRFPQEALAVILTGAPKRNSLIRLPGSVTLAGTIRAPHVIIPKQVKSAGNVFKAIGRAISGKQAPLARDADCAGLAAAALR